MPTLRAIKRLLFAIVPNRARELAARDTAAPILAHVELSSTEVADGVFGGPAAVAMARAHFVALSVSDARPVSSVDSELHACVGPGRDQVEPPPRSMDPPTVYWM